MFNVIFDFFSTRNSYLFHELHAHLVCVYEIHIHCMYSVSVVSLKIHLFVHLINSSESFDSSSFLNWMDCRQLSISHLCIYGFPILCHRPHSMSAFIYLLSELCVYCRVHWLRIRVFVLRICALVFHFSFRGCSHTCTTFAFSHCMLPNNWHDYFFSTVQKLTHNFNRSMYHWSIIL